MSRRAIPILAIFAAGAVLGAYAGAAVLATTPPAVVRDPLATANNPLGAKGKALKTGSVTVMKGPADDLAKVVRKIGPGQTGEIDAGEWIVEQPSTRHSSVNPTGRKTVIYLATLFPIGAPAAIPVS